jgi:hypothetical protein
MDGSEIDEQAAEPTITRSAIKINLILITRRMIYGIAT